MTDEHYPYEIQTRWRVVGRIDDVYTVLTDAESLPRWWPEAYRSVVTVADGDADGIGRVTAITTRGVLPYDVNWRVTVLEARAPELIRIAAAGDVEGRGEWRLKQVGEAVDLVYDWRVRVGKPWMQSFEFVLKPIFAANHNWVMRRGERGLRGELVRRSARDG
jgi:Polyketide cyclase / dehydrase and lipid transport